jgi:hypothetical protein
LTPVPANCNVDTAVWFFGKKDKGFVALFSGQGGDWTSDRKDDWKDKEIIADGDRNIFIIQIGNEDEYGSYEDFKRRVKSARVHINGLNWKLSDFQCSYDIPRTLKHGGGNDRLELHYDLDEDQVRLNGQPFDDNCHPRFETNYVKGGRVLWDQYHYTIRLGGHSLTHDFRGLVEMGLKLVRSINGDERTPKLIEKLMCRPQVRLDDRRTSDSPALAVAGIQNFTSETFKPYMAWKGVENDSSLYWSWFEAGAWTEQLMIVGARSTHSPAISSLDVGDENLGLLMAWKGEEDDPSLYYSTNSTLLPEGWQQHVRVNGAETSTRPALAQFGNGIVMAWKGVEDDTSVHFSYFNGRSWTLPKKVDGIGTDSNPALVRLENRLFMLWKGIEDDSNLYFSSLDFVFGVFQAQHVVSFTGAAGKVTRVASSVGPTLAASGSSLFAAWKGTGDDSRIWLSTFEDNEWSRQVSIKGVGTAVPPSAVGLPDARILLAWKGVEDDRAIYFTTLGTTRTDGTGIFFSWE